MKSVPFLDSFCTKDVLDEQTLILKPIAALPASFGQLMGRWLTATWFTTEISVEKGEQLTRTQPCQKVTSLLFISGWALLLPSQIVIA